ncbi:MAG TPA: GAF domain-containing protein [Paracoccaceae bacterium]|nr:GAF domain-containing protein [Paracoccaceae bacterium]
MTTDSQTIFADLHRTISKVVSIRLFTVSKLDRKARLSRRVYTSHPVEYPVTGTKPMNVDDWSKLVIDGKQTFVANRTADFAPYFGDHALINSLGCQSAVNIPVTEDGQVVATVNLLDVEDHFTPDRVAMLKALVARHTPDILAALRTANV